MGGCIAPGRDIRMRNQMSLGLYHQGMSVLYLYAEKKVEGKKGSQALLQPNEHAQKQTRRQHL